MRTGGWAPRPVSSRLPLLLDAIQPHGSVVLQVEREEVLIFVAFQLD